MMIDGEELNTSYQSGSVVADSVCVDAWITDQLCDSSKCCNCWM